MRWIAGVLLLLVWGVEARAELEPLDWPTPYPIAVYEERGEWACWWLLVLEVREGGYRLEVDECLIVKGPVEWEGGQRLELWVGSVASSQGTRLELSRSGRVVEVDGRRWDPPQLQDTLGLTPWYEVLVEKGEVDDDVRARIREHVVMMWTTWSGTWYDRAWPGWGDGPDEHQEEARGEAWTTTRTRRRERGRVVFESESEALQPERSERLREFLGEEDRRRFEAGTENFGSSVLVKSVSHVDTSCGLVASAYLFQEGWWQFAGGRIGTATRFVGWRFHWEEDWALLVLSEGAQEGIPARMWLFGSSLLHGRHGVEDPERGIDWLKRAADSGEPRAHLTLGMAYSEGLGAERDLLRAYRHLQTAVEADVPGAAATLEGFRIDHPEAIPGPPAVGPQLGPGW